MRRSRRSDIVRTHPHLDARVLDSPRYFRLARREATEPSPVVDWIREELESRRGRTLGRVIADPRTPFGDVVAVIDAFKRAGVEIVDLDRIERAPGTVRDSARLP